MSENDLSWGDHTKAFVQYPLADSGTCIRLLKILPGPPESDIELTLEAFDLESAPPFLGISYAWGDRQVSRVIIDGKDYEVRRNCHYALMQARLHYAGEYIWIDSICIDQDNLEEKSHQVQMMGKIYATTSLVLACVGPYDDDKILADFLSVGNERSIGRSSEHGIEALRDWLQSIGGEEGYISFSGPVKEPAFYWDSYYEVLGPWLTTLGDYEQRSLLQLTRAYWTFHKRPYWSRLWIVQEIAAANGRIRVLLGTSNLSWLAIGNCIRIFSGISNRLCTIIGQPQPANSRSGLSTVHNHAHHKRNIGSAIREFHDFQCSDTRDRIFGLLGIIDWPENSPPIIPDYTMSKSDLALILMEYCEPRDILYILTSLELYSSPGSNVGKLARAKEQPHPEKWHAAESTNTDALDTPPEATLLLEGCQSFRIVSSSEETLHICAKYVPIPSYEAPYLLQSMESLRGRFSANDPEFRKRPVKFLHWGRQGFGFACCEARVGDILVSWDQERPRLLLVIRESSGDKFDVIGQGFFVYDELLEYTSKSWGTDDRSLEKPRGSFELDLDLRLTIGDICILYGHDHIPERLLNGRIDYDCEKRFRRLLTNTTYIPHGSILPRGRWHERRHEGRNENALQVASFRGCEKTVHRLIGRVADINTQGGYYGNALQAAVSGGYVKVMQMLIDAGANVSAPGREYGNALQAASQWGHEKVVAMLIDRGADVNAQGGRYGNARQAAAINGYEKVVKMLVDGGANVHA